VKKKKKKKKKKKEKKKERKKEMHFAFSPMKSFNDGDLLWIAKETLPRDMLTDSVLQSNMFFRGIDIGTWLQVCLAAGATAAQEGGGS